MLPRHRRFRWEADGAIFRSLSDALLGAVYPAYLQRFAYCLSLIRSVTLAKLRQADLRTWTYQP